MQCDAKTIIESISTAILVTDSQLKVAFANTAAEQLFSMSRSKLQGIKLTELIDAQEKNLIETLQHSNVPTFQGFTATDITFSPDPHVHFHADMYLSLYTGRARGLVVVGGGEPENYAILEETQLHPIVNVQPTEEDVYEKLCDLITHPEAIPRLSADSRRYIERHHDYITVARRYLDFWSSK